MTKIGTRCVHAGYTPGNGEPRQIPIVQSTTFRYETSDKMGRLFDLEDSGYFYSRLQNPTVDHVAAKLANLEGGIGALLTSSGQTANLYACLNICQAGDHIVSAGNIYGGTFNLLGTTLRQMGIEVTFVNPDDDEEAISRVFRPRTKLLFGETLSNPGVEVLDIRKFARIAHSHGVPLIIDNTFATPILCRPFEFGADIVTHSTTKYIDGQGVTVGGALVDSGNFDWEAYPEKYACLCTPDLSYHGLVYTQKFGKAAYITKATTHLMRDLGGIQSPQNAFYLQLGLQTLHIRMARHCSSAQKVAAFLKSRPEVAWVHYPGLEDDSQYARAQEYTQGLGSGVMCLGLKGGREYSKRFMDHLQLITIETHVADCHSCILHPASHTHRQLTDEQLLSAGIAPDLIRLSIGLEDPEDLIEDIEKALKAATL